MRRRTGAHSPSGPTDSFTLGVDGQTRPVTLRLGRDGGRHMLLLGATGTGKTNALLWIAQHHIRAGFGFVMVDLKGDREVVERLRHEAIANGRSFHAFALDGGDPWNPLAHGSPTELKDKLIGSQTFSEEHYKRMYERYLLAVFRVLRSRGGPADLAQVARLLRPNELRVALRAVDDPQLAHDVGAYLAALTDAQKGQLSGLADRLSLLVESEMGLVPGEDPAAVIDLERTIRCGAVVVFSLDASTYPEAAQLVANLVAQDLKTVCGALERSPWLRRPALIAIDEFSGLAGNHLAGLFQRARSAWLSMLVATQEIADLRRVGDGFEEQLIGNVEMVLAGRQNNPRSADLLAAIAGSEEFWQPTFQVDRRSRIRGSPRGRVSVRLDERPLVGAEEIKRLRIGEMLMIDKNPHRVEVVGVASIGPNMLTGPGGELPAWARAQMARLRAAALLPEVAGEVRPVTPAAPPPVAGAWWKKFPGASS